MKTALIRSWSICICIATFCHSVFSAESDVAPSNEQSIAVGEETRLVRTLSEGNYAVANDDQGDWYVCRITVVRDETLPKCYIDGSTGQIVQPPGSLSLFESMMVGQITVIDPLPGSPAVSGWRYRRVVHPVVSLGTQKRALELESVYSGVGCALVQVRKLALPEDIKVEQDILHARPFPDDWKKDVAAGVTFCRTNPQKFQGDSAFNELIAYNNLLIKVAAMQAASKAHQFDLNSYEMAITLSKDLHICALATLFLLMDFPTSQYEDLLKQIHLHMTPENAPGIFLGAYSIISYPNANASLISSKMAFSSMLLAIGKEAEIKAPTSQLVQALAVISRSWIANLKIESERNRR